jgi:DMSO/TMAO reductase YedYZ heme-binding membrane subunit
MLHQSKWNLWLKAWGISFLIFIPFAVELFARRDWAVDIYLVNKVLASVGMVMITLSFLLSALRKFWGWFNRHQKHARYLGLVGLAYTILHIIATLYISFGETTPDKKAPGEFMFPFPDYFLQHWVSYTCAIIAFAIFLSLAKISMPSNELAAKKYGYDNWKTRLRYGYIGVILGVIHSAILKLAGWERWIDDKLAQAGNEPILPPLSLIVAILVGAMIVAKAFHLYTEKRMFRSS